MTGTLPGLVVLPAFNPGPLTGDGNHTYLLRGRRPAIVDAGTGDPRHLDALAAALDPGRPLVAGLVTHAHPDHASGAPAVASRWPEAEWAKFPWPGRDETVAVAWRALADGDRVEAGDLELEVIHTPGHAPDHVCLWHAPTRTLFGGDLLIEGQTVVIPGTRGGSLSAYLRSLRRVLALEPAVVLPAHGPVIRRPLDLIRRYIAHRAVRERQVQAAIAAGAVTVDAMTERLYGLAPGPLRRAAEESVRAHLLKLIDDGLVVERDGVYESVS